MNILSMAFIWLLFPALSHAQVASVPATTIKNISYFGSGCPLGSVYVDVSEDRNGHMLQLSEFSVEIGQGISAAKSRKNCVVKIALDIPEGWTVAPDSTQLQGYADLDSAVMAVYTTSFYFDGLINNQRYSGSLNGPYANDFLFKDDFSLSETSWLPCGVERALNVNYTLRLVDSPAPNQPKSHGLFEVYKISLPGFQWRRC